jgi:hypothetical protein
MLVTEVIEWNDWIELKKIAFRKRNVGRPRIRRRD